MALGSGAWAAKQAATRLAAEEDQGTHSLDTVRVDIRGTCECAQRRTFGRPADSGG